MGRAPCCDKVGLKRGPWTQDEDMILTSYIQQHGHGNWRALPKQAGLLRCGKSCRLRWTNYLRPDIKRGNFSKEEEDNIIQLHQVLGNRWSAIAGKLPGRTDNEIKNVWHTHLKKRVQNNQTSNISKRHSTGKPDCDHSDTPTDQSESVKAESVSQPKVDSPQAGSLPVSSPQRSSSDLSSVTEVRDTFSDIVEDEQVDISSEAFLEIDESFWADTFSSDDDGSSTVLSDGFSGKPQFGFPLSPLSTLRVENVYSTIDDGMDFWYDVYMKAEELPEF